MIMKEDGTLVVLEINTIPGMTKTSFVPAELLASGFTLAQFVEGMLKKYQ
jgi:D-alanine-D-alanine ligase